MVSAFCVRASEDPPSLSPDELVSLSNLIAIVEITEGVKFGDKYTLKADVVDTLKGRISSNVDFINIQPIYPDYPTELGGIYMVFLRNDDGFYKTIESEVSTIQLVWRTTESEERYPLDDYPHYMGPNEDRYWSALRCANRNRLCTKFTPYLKSAFNNPLKGDRDKAAAL